MRKKQRKAIRSLSEALQVLVEDELEAYHEVIKMWKGQAERAIDFHLDYIEGSGASAVDFLNYVEKGVKNDE